MSDNEPEQQVKWLGVDPDGIPFSGGMSVDSRSLAAVIRERYEQGWRELVATHDDRVVARIGCDEDGGRFWYSKGLGVVAAGTRCKICEPR